MSIVSVYSISPVSFCSPMFHSSYLLCSSCPLCSPMSRSPVCSHYAIMTCLVRSPVSSTFLLFVLFMTLPLLHVFVVRRWVRDSIPHRRRPSLLQLLMCLCKAGGLAEK